MKALILAAGYATRLYPITKEFPKPLLEVGKRPIIDYIIDKLCQIKEIDEIIVITNSRFFSHFKKWAKALKVNKRIKLVDDLTGSISDRRGAVGDMDFVIDKEGISDDILIVGGDNIFDGALCDFVAFAKKRKHSPVIGSYRVRDIKEAKKYGVIKLDGSGRITDFKEKPRAPQSRLVAMCVYYFPKDTLGLVREYLSGNKAGRNDATGFYIDWLRKQTAVYGFVFTGCWYDIGDHKFYNKAKVEFTG